MAWRNCEATNIAKAPPSIKAIAAWWERAETAEAITEWKANLSRALKQNGKASLMSSLPSKLVIVRKL
ncbi:MAG: hypothetical protein ACTS5F_00500 [Candidatus Hodgkinia cicadicola]